MPQNAPGDKGKPAFSRKVPLPKGAGGGAKGGTSFPPPSGQQGPQGGQGACRALWNRPLPGVPGVGEGLRLGEEAQQTVVDGVGQGPVPGGQGVPEGGQDGVPAGQGAGHGGLGPTGEVGGKVCPGPLPGGGHGQALPVPVLVTEDQLRGENFPRGGVLDLHLGDSHRPGPGGGELDGGEKGLPLRQVPGMAGVGGAGHPGVEGEAGHLPHQQDGPHP